MTYAIRFEFPDHEAVFAGEFRGAAGFAPTLLTALLFDREDSAHRFLANAYGDSKKYGRIILVKDGGVA